MNDSPTYQELEKQVFKLHKENEILGLNFSLQNLEKEKRASELRIANIELKYQRGEKKKRAAELHIANIELQHQKEEKKKRAAELVIATIELDYQSREKQNRADELKIANVELEYQTDEKKKRAAELIIANIELVFQKEQKAKRAAELIISKIKFAQQNDENQKLAEELIIANLAVDLQSELIVAKEKAEEHAIQLSELNATKDKLFSIVAHDLRSPFNNILSLSDLLAESLKNNETEDAEKLLNFIKASATSTLVLLENLLNWAKSQTGQINFNPKILNLSAIIKYNVDIAFPQAKIKNISMDCGQTDNTEVYADENMLRTVLRNLISNAIKFTKPGGQINILTIPHQNEVEISISDNGVGISAETIKKLFSLSENHTSAGTANESGSGLGLVLCKEFIEKFGGKIWVESEVGMGSDFKFTLPLKASND